MRCRHGFSRFLVFAGCGSGERGSVRGVSGGDKDVTHRLQPPDHAPKEQKKIQRSSFRRLYQAAANKGLIWSPVLPVR